MGRPPAAGLRLNVLTDEHPELSRFVEAIVGGDRSTFDGLTEAGTWPPGFAQAEPGRSVTRTHRVPE